MPVQLTKSSRLQDDESSGKSLACLEVCGVDLVELAAVAGNLLWWMLESAPDEGLVGFPMV